MKTLKEISASNPQTYRVIDLQVRKGEIKAWNDKIEIIVDGKSKFITRKNAYKFGLAEKI
jgi:hypothetical protein